MGPQVSSEPSYGGGKSDVSQLQTTCWTMILRAAAGSKEDRETFARLYLPGVRAYLKARWRNSRHLGEVDDAVQEVFLECFRQGGALDHVDPSRGTGFRAFLYGIVANVARRFEVARQKEHRRRDSNDFEPGKVREPEESLSRIFDRAWAKALLKEAGTRMAAQAREAGERALRRVELLRLRFEEELPIREIAARWGIDAAIVHHDYARAREEFKAALQEVVALHHPADPGAVERECAEILTLL